MGHTAVLRGHSQLGAQEFLPEVPEDFARQGLSLGLPYPKHELYTTEPSLQYLSNLSVK